MIEKNKKPTSEKVTWQEKMTKCPKCSYEQEPSDECGKCGIIFSKYFEIQESKEKKKHNKEREERLKKERHQEIKQNALDKVVSIKSFLFREIKQNALDKVVSIKSFLFKDKKRAFSVLGGFIFIAIFLVVFISFGRTMNVSGAAWVIKGSGKSDILRGLKVYILKRHIQKGIISDLLKEMLLKQAILFKSNSKTCDDIDDISSFVNEWTRQLFEGGGSYGESMKAAAKIDEHQIAVRLINLQVPLIKELTKYTKKPDNEMLDLKDIYRMIRAYNVIISFEDDAITRIKKDNLWSNVAAYCFVSETVTDIDGKYKIHNLKRDFYYVYAISVTSFSLIEWLLPIDNSKEGSMSVDLYNENAQRIINKKD